MPRQTSAEAIAVEDSVHGIESASRAGAFVIGFRFGGEPGDGPADVVAGSPGELREVVLERIERGGR